MAPPSPSSSLAAYARAVSSAKDLAAQVRSAVDAATLHAAASPTTPVGPRELHIVALSASARAWEEEMREAAAWGEIVREVSRMLAIRDARAARRALLALEQVQMAMLTLRALISSTLQESSGVGKLREALGRVAHSAASLVHAAYATDPRCTGLLLPLSMTREQDRALPWLHTLGCQAYLRSIRAMSVPTLLQALSACAPASQFLQPFSLHPSAASVEAECARSWDTLCLNLTPLDSGNEQPLGALLRLLRWLRPLVLASPPPPSWLLPLSSSHPPQDMTTAAATWLQRRWRARKRRWAQVAQLRAEAERSLVQGDSLRHAVLHARASILSDLRPEAAAATLLSALRPEDRLSSLRELERRSILQLQCLNLVLAAAMPPPSQRSGARLPQAFSCNNQSSPAASQSLNGSPTSPRAQFQSRLRSPTSGALSQRPLSRSSASPPAPQPFYLANPTRSHLRASTSPTARYHSQPPPPPISTAPPPFESTTHASELPNPRTPSAHSPFIPLSRSTPSSPLGEAELPEVTMFWEANFGHDEVSASFDGVRTALSSELGNISSVDLQLLRLELMDERGRLSRAALGRIMWDEAGMPYASVVDAIKALLKQARIQLERQVEARMQQALSTRPGGTGRRQPTR
ncbi:MAG: hypothetical protein SGPRY_003877 [Prymnesium sp.]